MVFECTVNSQNDLIFEIKDHFCFLNDLEIIEKLQFLMKLPKFRSKISIQILHFRLKMCIFVDLSSRIKGFT